MLNLNASLSTVDRQCQVPYKCLVNSCVSPREQAGRMWTDYADAIFFPNIFQFHFVESKRHCDGK